MPRTESSEHRKCHPHRRNPTRQLCPMFRYPGIPPLGTPLWGSVCLLRNVKGTFIGMSEPRSPSRPYPPTTLSVSFFLPLSPLSMHSPWVLLYLVGYSTKGIISPGFALDGDRLKSDTNPCLPLSIQVCWRWRVDALVACGSGSTVLPGMCQRMRAYTRTPHVHTYEHEHVHKHEHTRAHTRAAHTHTSTHTCTRTLSSC